MSIELKYFLRIIIWFLAGVSPLITFVLWLKERSNKTRRNALILSLCLLGYLLFFPFVWFSMAFTISTPFGALDLLFPSLASPPREIPLSLIAMVIATVAYIVFYCWHFFKKPRNVQSLIAFGIPIFVIGTLWYGPILLDILFDFRGF